MLFRNALTIFVLFSLGVVCLARTQFRLSPESFEVDFEDQEGNLFSKSKEFTWGNRRGSKKFLFKFFLFLLKKYNLEDYRVYEKHDRTRRGGSGTKTLVVKYDGIEKVTEVILEVTSDSDDIEARVIKGGVGKDNMKIEITGRHTSYLEYNVEVFGKP